MGEENTNYDESFLPDINTKIRDLEEKQRTLKERVIIMSQNLIEEKEKNKKINLELKKDIMMLKQNTERLVSFLEAASGEFSKFAKKEDLDILIKQAKMFQPLEFVRKSDLNKNK